MTILETVWTILPALLLIAIAFPSFRLLYLMDWHRLEFTDITILNSILILHRKYSTNNKKVKRINDKSITLIKSDCKVYLFYILIL